jgi:hypothetical protein
MLEFGPVGGGTELRIYISGDTLMYDGLREIPRRYPDIDLGVVHLGGTNLLGLAMVTMDGRQGADWTELVRCRRVVPVHYDDYTVFGSPLSDYEEETRARGLADVVHPIERGTALPLGDVARETSVTAVAIAEPTSLNVGIARDTAVISKTLRTMPPGGAAAYRRRPAALARVFARNSALIADESQNVVPVRSAMIGPSPALTRASSCSRTPSALDVSISDGSSTTV